MYDGRPGGQVKRAAQIAVVVVGCLAGDSARAQSAATCSFDPGAAVVTVEVHGAPAVVERAGNEILLNGASCGGATTFTTDSIAVTGGAKVNVVTLVGKFAPGATVETNSAASEVEVTFDLGPGLDSVTLVYDDTSEVIEFGANGVDLEGDGDVDVFTAGVETVGVMAMGGDDTIDGLAYLGGLVLDGGDGADVIQGSPGADRLVGGAGVDDLSGRGGADRIEGGADGDLLRGGPGDDFLDGGAGDDDCLGDAGADLSYQGSAMDGADTFAGGLGKDTIYYSERTNGVSVSLDNDPTSGEAGEGHRIGVDVENITGGAGADQLYGNDVANTILGNQGSDDILGVGGNDILYGGQGSDVLQGGPGNDDLRGEGGNDIFLAEATIDGRDTFFGGAGTDKVAYDSRSSSVTLTAGNQLTDDG